MNTIFQCPRTIVTCFMTVIFTVFFHVSGGAPDTLWTRAYGGAASDWGYSVHETGGGGFIVAGETQSTVSGMTDACLILTNANGDTLWTKTFGGVESDYGSSAQQTADGGFIVAGTTQSFASGGVDMWLIRIGKEATAMQDHLSHPVSWSGHAGLWWNEKNYGILIRYQINEPGAVKLSVYTAQGRLVKVLVNTIMNRGSYDAQWDFKQELRASGGAYFLVLQTEGSFVVKRIVALKSCPADSEFDFLK